jgi:hypothetical protein
MAAIGVMSEAADSAAQAQRGPRPEHVPGFKVDCGTGSDVRHVGIVFVHGIGSQLPGETLLDWGGAMIGMLLDRRIAQKTDGDPVIACDLDPAPSKSRYIELQLPKADASGGREPLPKQHWILTEAWWAQQVRPPPFGQMADWLGPRGAIRRIALAMLPRRDGVHDARKREAAMAYPLKRVEKTDNVKEHVAEKVAEGRALGQKVVVTGWTEGALSKAGQVSAGIYIQAISALVLVLYGALRSIEKLLPIGPLKGGALTRPIDRFMLDWFGDVYVLLSNPAQAAGIRSQLVEALRDLHANNCETVVVVAHSGGAIVSYMTLADSANNDIAVDRFITLGEGINLAWRLTIGPDGKLDEDTRNRYRRLYLSPFKDRPKLEWHDFWASQDPAPVGVLDPERETLGDADLGRIRSHAIWNRLAVAEDHGAYWDNDEEFLLPMLRLIEGGEDKSGLLDAKGTEAEQSTRRRRRLSILSVGRQLTRIAPTAAFVTAFALGSPFPTRLGDAVASVWNGIPGSGVVTGPLNDLRKLPLGEMPWAIVSLAGVSMMALLIGVITLYALIAPVERPVAWATAGTSDDGRKTFAPWVHDLLEFGPWIVGFPVMVAVLVAAFRLVADASHLGAQVAIVVGATGLEILVLTLFWMVTFGSSTADDQHQAKSTGSYLLEIFFTIIFLVFVTFLTAAPFVAILAYPDVGKLALGFVALYAAFQIIGRIGAWRWNVWDGRERVALRAGKLDYPPLQRVVIQFSLLLATVVCLFAAAVLNSDPLAIIAAVGVGTSVLLGVAIDVFNSARQERTAPTVMGPRAGAYKM